MSAPVRLGLTARSEVLFGVAADFRGMRQEGPNVVLEWRDWTVDGVPLRQLIARQGEEPTGHTVLTSNELDRPFAIATLLALLGEYGPTAPNDTDPWVRYADGRTALLVCEQCGDLDCYSVSAEVVIGPEIVEWRDIAYQVGYDPLDLASQEPLTLTFDRSTYETFLRGELSRWITASPASVLDASGMPRLSNPVRPQPPQRKPFWRRRAAARSGE